MQNERWSDGVSSLMPNPQPSEATTVAEPTSLGGPMWKDAEEGKLRNQKPIGYEETTKNIAGNPWFEHCGGKPRFGDIMTKLTLVVENKRNSRMMRLENLFL